MSFLNVEHLSFTYAQNTENQKVALSDISFSLSKGEYLVVTGSNGSGKSTLARIIAGLLKAQSGSVSGDSFRKNDSHKKTQKKIPITSVPNGMVMQNAKNQLIAETVIKDASFGPENLNLPKDECIKRAEQALELMDMLNAREQLTATLSGGQQQKLCIAGILALTPELLILDEALSMVDPERRGIILNYIDEYHKNGGTILSITHNKDEASRSTRLIHLQQGKIVFDGTFPEFSKTHSFFSPTYEKRKITTSLDEKTKNNIIINVENLEYTYPKQTELFKNFSLSIQKGTLTAIIGQSGSGKSTLFELLSGLLIQKSGNIYAKSRPVLAGQDCASTIFEEFAADDVAYGPQQLGLSGKALKQAVKNAMDTAGVPFNDYADRRTTFLSGGERRKLSIAGIIALDAEIYLFDEPTAALDPESAVATIKLMQDLCSSGKTVIFSTHRIEEAEAADRTIILDQGKIISDSAQIKNSAYNELYKVTPYSNAADIASLSSSAIGSYNKGNSIIHKTSPLAKYIVLLFFFITVLTAPSILLLSVICTLSVVYVLLAQYPIKKLFKNFLIVLPWISIFFIFQLCFFPPQSNEKVIASFYFISLTTRKIELGLYTTLHYLGILCSLSAFVHTSTESDITDGMESLLKPFSFLGIQTKHICLITSIIFRFIPLLMEEAAIILKAQTVRSSGTLSQPQKKSSILSKFRLLLPLFIPLFIRTLQRAELLAEALDARYYGYY